MSTTPQNNDNQEIDLSQISNGIGKLYEKILTSIFNVIQFIKNRIIWLGLLFILGAGLGFYLDSERVYDSQIIVSPAGGGVDYLYSKIDLLSSKLVENDQAFIKGIGIKNSSQIQSIKIEPIIDLYNFVNNNTAIASNAQNTQNFEVIKLLAESNDINSVIKDELTSKNYPYHSLVITSKDKISQDEIIKPILKYLNTDDYLNQITKITKENILIQLEKNKNEIVQVDSLINTISRNIGKNDKGSNLIYNNENNQLTGLFDLKNRLVGEIASGKIQLVKIDTFIKDVSITPNVINSKGLNGKLKLVLPFLFCFMFIFISVFISFYRNQAAKQKL
ncbi:hypothetical protein [Flavobacterium sp.]|uniref:hypothetical protein n=1 Tax=Flavobacterium sp. TaxID=239 RepID=UPI002617D7E3|nr:hypothetical protein [Flavobacterium sp.]